MIGAVLQLFGFVLRHPIGRRRPLRCLADTLSWQLSAGPTPRPVPFVGDARLYARRSETGVTGNIYVGLHEFPEMAFVAHVLRPGDLFGDIGANSGSYSVLAAKIAGSRVVAVEPVPETVARLRLNIALNAIEDRVEIHATAVGDHEGTVRFTIDGDTINRIASHIDGDRKTLDVPVMRLDRLFADRIPTVLKIDVEGHEAMVLAGAANLLAQDRLLAVIVEVGAGFGLTPDDSLVERKLRENGFAAVDYDPFRRVLTEVPYTVHRRRENVLWVRDRARVEDRLRTAVPLMVKGLPI